MADSSPDLQAPFSTRLRQSTSREHAAAEATGFFRSLFQGEVTRRQYAEYLAALHEVYRALETALQHCHQHFLPGRQFYQQGLLRQQALQDDVAFYAPGLDPAHVLREAGGPLRGAVHRYARCIREAGEQNSLLLAAHAYVRYLGDLSGGQILAHRVAQLFELTPDDPRGLHFYQFPEIPDPDAFKDNFRRQLDSLPTQPATADALENEAKLAFRLNIALLESLEE